MSKYHALWEHIAKTPGPTLTLTFEEVEAMRGVPLDHSFLTYKKELAAYSWQVEKISMKKRTVAFLKRQEPAASG